VSCCHVDLNVNRITLRYSILCCKVSIISEMIGGVCHHSSEVPEDSVHS